MQVLDNLEIGDWNRAASSVEEGHRLAHETGQPIWDVGSLSLNAMVVALRGDNERAQAMAAEVEHAAGGRGLNDLLSCVQLSRGFGMISAGQYGGLRRAGPAVRPGRPGLPHVRAVPWHLYRTFPKLEITSRAQLAARLG